MKTIKRKRKTRLIKLASSNVIKNKHIMINSARYFGAINNLLKPRFLVNV